MYYYFTSTLPMINFDGTPPLSLGDFVSDCERLLSAKDYADARIVLGMDEGDVRDRAFRRWQRFDRALKNETAFMRATHLQRNPAGVMTGEREFDSRITAAVAQAAKTDDLMEAEKMLMRLQWEQLDEITGNNLFSLDVILAYGLKLKILERLAAFKTEEGSKMFEEIVSQSGERKEINDKKTAGS